MKRLGFLAPGALGLLAPLCMGCPADEVAADTDATTLPQTTGVDPGSTTDDITTGIDPSTDDGTVPGDSSSDGADSSSGEPPDPVCGDGVVEGDEKCDGANLDGVTCIDEGFEGGELACSADCRKFVTTDCFFFFCGNGTVQGDELCDGTETGAETCITQGFESGTLMCNANCSGYDTSTCGVCGDGEINGAENCEGADLDHTDCEDLAFDGGTLGCNADCSFDTSDCSMCGDGVATGFESCDGADLGGQTCASLGLEGGTLGCQASCIYDFSACDIVGIPFGNDGVYSGFELSLPGALPCDDISATGTATGLTDDSNQVVAMGFTFNFYGSAFTDANIESNGTLRFGDASYLGYGNNCLPTATTPNTYTIYPFWDDLNPGSGASEVRYQTFGGAGNHRFVVQWDTAHFSGDTADLIRFQVMLHEATGEIDVCYVDMLSAGNAGDNGAEATSGIQQDGTTGLQFSCNTPDLTDGTMLMYVPL